MSEEFEVIHIFCFQKIIVTIWRWDEKTNVCMGTRGGNETFLNTVAHENVKVYMNQLVCEIFFEIFLNFFKNCPQLIFL